LNAAKMLGNCYGKLGTNVAPVRIPFSMLKFHCHNAKRPWPGWSSAETSLNQLQLAEMSLPSRVTRFGAF